MELEQATARITDDPAGVVGPGDDLDRAGERLVYDGVHLSRIRRRDRCLQVVDGLMHLPTVRVRRAPPPAGWVISLWGYVERKRVTGGAEG
jgi:hypothetical protein